MKRRIILALALATALALSLAADPSSFAFEPSGGVNFPLGGDAAVFEPGPGASLAAAFGLAEGLPLDLLLNLDYSSAGVRDSGGRNLSRVGLSGGLRFSGIRLGILGLDLSAQAGGFAAFLDDGGAPGFSASAGGSLGIVLGEGSFRPFVRASYAYSMGLGQEISVAGGLAFHPGTASGPKPSLDPATGKPRARPLAARTGPSGLEVVSFELEPVFPVFFRYYDTNPLGHITVRNAGSAPIEGLRADLLVKQFMDNAKECAGPAMLKPGEEATVPLYALFNDSILGVSEGNKVSGNLSLAYRARGKDQKLDLTTTLSLYDRNALTWSDDRRAAAFVTAKDPVILKFAKNLAGFLGDAKRYGQPGAVAAAMGVFESMRAFGMRYVVDPTASYASVSSSDSAVDFVQFPRQTLDYKAGDCDDLSVLTAALLEALGAKTAFITVPGHIYVAVDLELAPAEALARLSQDAIVVAGDRAWLPLEITALTDDFLKAWELGAREWREASSQGQAKLYPVAEAWEVYAPVGFVSEAVQAQPPDAAKLASACLPELERYVERGLEASTAKVLADMKKEGRTPRLVNKLAVLYAQVGLRPKARTLFIEATSKKDFAPALVNLGNLAFLDRDFNGALAFYQRAYRLDQKDARVVLALARASNELEDFSKAREYYGSLKKLDADLAGRFSYLELKGEDSTRAADALGMKEIVVWTE